MFVDSLLTVAGTIAGNTITAQTATGTDTSVLSDKSVDLQTARDIGEGQDVYLRAQCRTSSSGGTSVEVQAIGADDAALTSNVVVLGTSGAIAVASMIAGKRVAIKLPAQIGSLGKRYIGARFVFVGAVAAGAYVADYGIGVEDAKNYASGFSVL